MLRYTHEPNLSYVSLSNATHIIKDELNSAGCISVTEAERMREKT